ncbi:MAG: Maf-like protein [Candidatus Parcubacteria bacterium]|jgi:septum formation protein
MRKIVLASASERRASILKLAGISFVVQESKYEEDLSLKLSPKKLAQHLALGKALAVASSHSDALIIGADTFIVFRKKIVGKPGTKQRVEEILMQMSGKSHTVLTGYALVDTKNGRTKTGVVETKVFFRKLSLREVTTYAQTGKPDPRYLAGGYAIQSEGARFVSGIEGDFYNVVGLPLAQIISELSSFGIIP